MKLKSLICFVVFFIATSGFVAFTQTNQNSKYFVIKGKITNSKYSYWEFSINRYFDDKMYQVPINNDGSFFLKVLSDNVQDLNLFLNNDTLTIYSFNGDTLELKWDENDFNNSISITSKNVERNKDLQKNLKIYRKLRSSTMSLINRLYKERKTADSIKFKWVNENYNNYLKLILEDTSSYTKTNKKFLIDAYYMHVNLLSQHNLLKQTKLTPDTFILNPSHLSIINFSLLHLLPQNYKSLDDVDFENSSEYRSFLYNYIQQSSLFDFFSMSSNTLEFTPVRDQYYNALANIRVSNIRDWYITKSIINGFQFYDFIECESVLNDFLKICKTVNYKDTLNKFYDFVKKFKPGNIAPEFSLKDNKGKYISLIDFKDKVVYIDFWGVSCGPCRDDIKNAVPVLHKKYHNKDVVFLNICVDSDEQTWKKALEEFQLDGVNLIAEGWVNNPTCKTYNINMIPHYILVDKSSKLVDYNAKSPWELINDGENKIDIFLEK